MGGKVKLASKREFGHAKLRVLNKASGLLKGITKN